MRARLVAHWGAQQGSEFWIGAEAAIGRGADNDVRLDAKPISSQHARIYFDPEAGAYFLEDLGSLNGTEIDGTPVARTERLGRLHVLNFGGVCELMFVTVDTDAAAADASAAAKPAPGAGTQVDSKPLALPADLAPAAAGEPGREVTRVEEAAPVLPDGLSASGGPEPAAPEYVLAVIEKGLPRRFPLRDGENLVGRAKGAEVALRSRQLSRRHAVLTIAGDRVTVRDLGSRNHTYVDDVEVEAETETEVPPRSRLRFGLVDAHLLRRGERDDLTAPMPLAKD